VYANPTHLHGSRCAPSKSKEKEDRARCATPHTPGGHPEGGHHVGFEGEGVRSLSRSGRRTRARSRISFIACHPIIHPVSFSLQSRYFSRHCGYCMVSIGSLWLPLYVLYAVHLPLDPATAHPFPPLVTNCYLISIKCVFHVSEHLATSLSLNP
jgi:hypothetical protein